MNLTQLRAKADFYHCHVESKKGHITVYGPGYATSTEITNLDGKSDKEIQTLLEELSGKKLARAWDSGKGGAA